jgi:hypothetical protein
MPLDVTVKTISPLDLKDEASVLHIKVFPVPPYPLRKKTPPFCDFTTLVILSYMTFCSSIKQQQL